MRLTERDKKVALALQFHAREPLGIIAKRLKMREHLVRYSLQRLLQQGIIRPTAWINHFKLGYGEYRILFTVGSEQKMEQQFIDYIENSPYTAWFAELGGRFQYGASICVKNIRELSVFFDDIEKRFGKVLLEKSVTLLVNFTIYTKKYLAPKSFPPEAITIGEADDTFRLDETDQKILADLTDAGIRSHFDVARSSSLPRSTVAYRLKGLEDKGIISRYIYFISALKMGMLPFKILIFSKGAHHSLRGQLQKYALEHPNIVNMHECLGNWDFEITVEVGNPQEVAPIVKRLYGDFSGLITGIDVIPILKQMQSKSFMRFSRGKNRN